MAVQRFLVTLHTVDANPANFITNTFYADDGDVPVTSLPAFAAALADEYISLGTFFSAHLAQNGHEIQSYKMSDPTPRVPTYETTFNFVAAPSGQTLPTEVALVASFQADRVSGLPQSRRRGRVYLGPFDTAYTTDGRPTPALIAAVVSFAGGLHTAEALADWTWVVFSGVDQGAAPVTNGWVDNSWDTQRRRGVEWTARSTWD